MTGNPRDALTEALQYGRITPAQAEARLRELGLAPLLPQPDPVDFDPMREAHWTLVMAIAWVAWRSTTEVAQVSERFREKVLYLEEKTWRDGPEGPHYTGWFAKWGGPANLAYLLTRESNHRKHDTLPRDALTITEARDALWSALSRAALQATGIDTASGMRVSVPDHEWRTLVDVVEGGYDVVLHGKHGLVNSKRGYRDILFPRENIVGIWSMRPPTTAVVLPATMSPHGAGYMPLYCAAQWIATEGGTLNIDPDKMPVWREAYAELLSRIASDEVVVTGVTGGERAKLDGFLFASMAVDYPFAEADMDLMFSEQLHLVSYPYIDEEHWRNGIDDSLRDRSGKRASQLMVLKADVARCWPFKEKREPPETHSGAAGRPSAMHFVEAEYARRRAIGELRGGIGAVAAELAMWAKNTHPRLRTPTARTIANVLRERHRKSTK